MKSYIGIAMVIFGVLILLLAIAMPATTTQKSETCYNDPFSYGQSCSTITYESPNTGRASIMGTGVFFSLLGIGVILLGSDSNKSTKPTISNDNTEKLAEVVNRSTENNNSMNNKQESENNN